MSPPESRLALVLIAVAAAPAASAADPALRSTDRFPYRPGGALAVDGGILVGRPAVLPTGLARGLDAGISWGRMFALGARIGWTTATESTAAWRVTHSDVRLRATGAVRREVGRGAFGLRLGLGGTLVRESRQRNQGERAGLSGEDLATDATAMLPAGDLEAVLSLHVAGPWLVTMAAGPSLAVSGGDATTSWTAHLGVAWQP